MRIALVLVALLLAAPVQAKSWQCALYPKTCPVPVTGAPPVELPVAPVEVAPVAAAPLPAPRPVAKAPVRVDTRQKVTKHKPKFKKNKRRRYTVAELAAMPGLIWPCALIRSHTAGKTRAQLIAEGQSRGVALNPRQIKEVCDCGVRAACGVIWS